ncbi:MAG TPA: 50S ribosomal protein L1 [Lacipirellulaceae bacterium]|jgi:large subunit ribosomal protein L1|nr:50S ribosomal protein L1 [Lacipirellulaceae bacterium]
MAKQSKRFRALATKRKEDPMPLAEAVKILKGFDGTKFDQSVEIAIRLGIDNSQADQLVRGSIVLPHGIGKQQRVVVFAKGAKAEEAKAAGADFVGEEDLADKIKGGWTEFDACIAAPDMMKLVGPLGKVLGPRGLMPSPRAGTVTPEIGKTVAEYKAGKVEFRNDKAGIVQAVVGKMSFDSTKLTENIQAFLDKVGGMKSGAVKGAFIKGAHISATMSPSVRLAV